MLDPYKMVLINIMALLLFASGLFCYKFIYPKKNPNLFILLIIISLLPLISVFRTGVYESGDFNLHIYRTMAFYSSLKDGYLMPSWAGDLNAHYGYPLFIFLNPLPYYIMSFFHFVGFSFIMSMKLFLCFSFITSGIGMFLLIKNTLKKDLPSFVAGVIYLFSPYHLVDLHFRTAVGEVLFFAVFPFYMLSLFLLTSKPKLSNLLASSILLSFLFLSHQAMALLSLILVLSYSGFLLFKNTSDIKKKAIYLCCSFLIGAIISMYSWIPHITYTHFTLPNVVTDSGIMFQNFSEYIYSTWRFGFLFQGPYGQLSFIIGYTEIAAVILVLFSIFEKQKTDKFRTEKIFWISVLALLILLLLPISGIIWDTIPYLAITQFSYRLLLFITFIVAILSGLLSMKYLKKPWIIYLFIIISICYTILNWGNRHVIPEITDTTLTHNLPMSTYQGEGLTYMGSPRWINVKKPWMNVIPKNNLEVLSGSVQIKNVKRTTTDHEYIASVISGSLLKENTYYFPGWNITVDGKPIAVKYTSKKYPDIMTFKVSRGIHYIRAYYEDLPFFKIIKIISLFSFLFAITMLVILKTKNKFESLLPFID